MENGWRCLRKLKIEGPVMLLLGMYVKETSALPHLQQHCLQQLRYGINLVSRDERMDKENVFSIQWTIISCKK